MGDSVPEEVCRDDFHSNEQYESALQEKLNKMKKILLIIGFWKIYY